MSSPRPPAPADGRGWRAALARGRRRLTQRLILIAGGLILLRLNGAVGDLLGFPAPTTPEAITVGFARVLAVAMGVWMIYRGVR